MTMKEFRSRGRGGHVSPFLQITFCSGLGTEKKSNRIKDKQTYCMIIIDEIHE